MKIKYFKYQSSGNNFILIDVISENINFDIKINTLISNPIIKKSDGILILANSKKNNFDLSFYNPDGSRGFCGNGSLCSLHYLKAKNEIKETASFLSLGKKYFAKISSEISLKMKNIKSFKSFNDEYFIDSGAPHHIKFVDDANSFDIKKEANLIRKRSLYRLTDCNVNLVSDLGNGSIYVRTFEKGVERETLSCGTGAVASVIAFSLHKNYSVNNIITKGGELKVFFKRSKKNYFTEIFLIGNPKEEYSGEIIV
tara:strand:- start:1065 stop:1829 length:765 start_codon:yes stop_codon:yes gene_type:complete